MKYRRCRLGSSDITFHQALFIMHDPRNTIIVLFESDVRHIHSRVPTFVTLRATVGLRESCSVTVPLTVRTSLVGGKTRAAPWFCTAPSRSPRTEGVRKRTEFPLKDTTLVSQDDSTSRRISLRITPPLSRLPSPNLTEYGVSFLKKGLVESGTHPHERLVLDPLEPL